MPFISVTAFAQEKESNNPNTSSSLLDTEIFTEEEKVFIRTAKPIRICNVIQQASDEASIDIVKIIAEKSGLKFTSTPLLSWGDSLEAFVNGRCDILPWATKTEERSKTMNFTRPYVRIKRVVIAKKEEPYFRDLYEVSDKVFAMLRGNYAVAQIRKNHPTIEFVFVETVEDELEYIVNDQVYGTIVSLYSAANLFNNKVAKELKVVGVLPPEYDDIASLATMQTNSLLHSILEKSLIATDPQLIDDFMTQGAVLSHSPTVNYEKYWDIVLIVTIALTLLIWWVFYLRKLNQKLKDSQQKLELLSITDSLTKVYNRVKMDEVFVQQIQNSKRYLTPVSVIMLDIDFFKKINDQHGHTVGDEVLKKIAQVLQTNLRTNDFLGRWGGEEFLIICPLTDLENAIVVAEKLRVALLKENFAPLEEVTASFGVAQWRKGETQESLISRADEALYQAKNEGRNRVCS